MQAIGFNEPYGLQEAVLKRLKTMTRRSEKGFENLEEGNFYFNKARCEIYLYGEKGTIIETIKTRYKIGEVVAIRQRYRDIAEDMFFINAIAADGHCVNAMKHDAGWDNKMFVKAAYMPHHIRITDLKVERLKDISKEDCLREGIDEDYAEGTALYWWSVPHEGISWEEYKKRNYELARHELNGETGSYFWDTPQGAFAALIDKVSGKGTWDRNLFMPAYTFELID